MIDENYTSLNSHERVLKSDLRIEFRGCLDELNARMILIQAENQNDKKFLNDIEQLRQVILKLQRSEVMNENYGALNIFGLDENKIHELSHNPEHGHVLLCHEIGIRAAEINLLRVLIRRAEILAVRAFHDNDFDYAHVLNRLSSAAYNLIHEYLPESFDKFFRFTHSK